jgi:uncharacterized membrane protein
VNTLLLVTACLASLALGIAIEWTRHHHASPAAIALAALILLLAADRLYRRWVSAAVGGQDLGRHAGPRKTKPTTAEQPAIIAPTRLELTA